jgi:hypothetical protein
MITTNVRPRIWRGFELVFQEREMSGEIRVYPGVVKLG